MRRVRDIDGLELISHGPASPAHPVPLLFVHGAFVAAWCWDDYFLPYFARLGFDAHALSLRGHGGSTGQEALSLASMEDYETDVLRIVQHIGKPVVIVGHSMGGMVVQRCLHRASAAAAVLMASVPPEGLLGSSFLLAARDPGLFFEISRIQNASSGFTAARDLQRAVFSERLTDAEVERHFTRMQPESQRAIFELSWPQYLFVGHAASLPILVLGGASDAFFPAPMVESTARFHGAEVEILPDIAHAMMLDPDWQQAADRIAGWLAGIGM